MSQACAFASPFLVLGERYGDETPATLVFRAGEARFDSRKS
jgi:hypothetical protein